MAEQFGIARASKMASPDGKVRANFEPLAVSADETVTIDQGGVDALRRVQDKIRQLKELEEDLKRRVIESLGGVGTGVSESGQALVKYSRVDQTRLDTKRLRADLDESLISQYTVTSPTYRLTVLREEG